MWLEYFEQYADNKLPLFLKAKPWNYKNDISMLGFKKLADATGETKWNEYILKSGSYLLKEDGTIDNWFNGEKNSDKVSFGKTFRILHELTQDSRYLSGVEEAYRMLEGYPRTETGNFWHKDIYPHQVWLDGLYMIMPFYAQSLIEFHENSWDDIFDQFQAAHKLLWNNNLKLYAHANDCSRLSEWSDKTTGQSQVVWLRAVGWFFMALVDTYEISYKETVRAEELKLILEYAAQYMLDYLDTEVNMFHQIVNRNDLQGNYPETSGSAMMAYTFMKASRLGLLEDVYGQTGSSILDSIMNRYLIREEGVLTLKGICASAGLGPGPDNRDDRDGTPEYYLREKQMNDNQHGTAACMMAVSEQLLRKS